MTFDPLDVMEHYRERASVIEFDGGLPRQIAEAHALNEVRTRYGREAAEMVERHRENNK